MKSNELYHAEQLANELRQHIRLGFSMKNASGLEEHALVRFNCIADKLLSEVGVTVSTEDHTSDGFNERMVSMEGLLSRLKDFIFRKKKEDDEPKVSLYELLVWLDEQSSNAINSYQQSPNTVALPKRYSAFYTAPHGIDVNAVTKDLAAYNSIFSKYKGKMEGHAKFIEDVHKKFKPFYGNTDKKDAFLALLRDLEKKQPDSIARGFTEPNHSFIGYGKEPFKDGVDSFSGESPIPESKGIVKATYPTKEEYADIVGLAKACFELYELFDTVTSDFPAYIDVTDPPVRGYIEDDDIGEIVSRSVYMMELYWDQSIELFFNCKSRIEHLLTAIILYLKALSN